MLTVYCTFCVFLYYLGRLLTDCIHIVSKHEPGKSFRKTQFWISDASSFLTVISSSCCSTHASMWTWTIVSSLPDFHLAVRELCSLRFACCHCFFVFFVFFTSSPRTSSIVKGPLKVWLQSWWPAEKTITLQTAKQQNPQELTVAQHICGLNVTVCYDHFCPFVLLSSNNWNFSLGQRNNQGLNQKVWGLNFTMTTYQWWQEREKVAKICYSYFGRNLQQMQYLKKKKNTQCSQSELNKYNLLTKTTKC